MLNTGKDSETQQEGLTWNDDGYADWLVAFSSACSVRVCPRRRSRIHTGETFDFLWTPERPGEVALTVRHERFFEKKEVVLTKIFRVHG